jgi:hypothetical protein
LASGEAEAKAATKAAGIIAKLAEKQFGEDAAEVAAGDVTKSLPKATAEDAMRTNDLARTTKSTTQTAGVVGATLARSDLSHAQLTNFNRYVKKLPAGVQDPVITRRDNGSVQFSADVLGRVPGSYATYTKIVDGSGVTTDYYKTTIGPDGSIVHIKVEFP